MKKIGFFALLASISLSCTPESKTESAVVHMKKEGYQITKPVSKELDTVLKEMEKQCGFQTGIDTLIGSLTYDYSNGEAILFKTRKVSTWFPIRMYSLTKERYLDKNADGIVESAGRVWCLYTFDSVISSEEENITDPQPYFDKAKKYLDVDNVHNQWEKRNK